MRHAARGSSRATLAIMAITLLGLASTPATGLCQAPGATVPRTPIDVTASIGAFGANHQVAGVGGANWSSSLFKGLGIGYYWSDHVKTEIEAAWPGPTEAYGYFPTRLADGTTAFAYDEHSFRTFNLSAGQLYQFGRNSFFHPFAGAGVDVSRERDRNERTTETSRGPARKDITDATVVRARPFVTTGFKAYFSERAFFRGELKLDVGSRVEQMVWKAGFGVDF